MAVVLCSCGETKVCLSIVEAVVVYVVDDQARRNFYYTAVHIYGGSLALSTDAGIAFGIEGVAVFGDVPFVFIQPVEVVGVNDGKFALSKSNTPESVAVANASIQKHRKDSDALKPVRDSDGYFCDALLLLCKSEG